MRKTKLTEDPKFLELLSEYKELDAWFKEYSKSHSKKKVVKGTKPTVQMNKKG